MSESRDILVGWNVKIDSSPTKVTESFDGENEGITYSKLNTAFTQLKTDLSAHYSSLAAEFAAIGVTQKPWKGWWLYKMPYRYK